MVVMNFLKQSTKGRMAIKLREVAGDKYSTHIYRPALIHDSAEAIGCGYRKYNSSTRKSQGGLEVAILIRYERISIELYTLSMNRLT
jgi:hypothetical protein